MINRLGALCRDGLQRLKATTPDGHASNPQPKTEPLWRCLLCVPFRRSSSFSLDTFSEKELCSCISRWPLFASTPRTLQLVTLLVLLTGASAQQAQALGVGQHYGILAEYFLENYHTCTVTNGSFRVFEHLLPNMTRKDTQINFQNRLEFKMRRCVWENNVYGQLVYSCRGDDETTKFFAARYTGYLFVLTAGLYEFEMEVDDGARLTIGHGRCPHVTCATFEETMNANLSKLLPTSSQGSSPTNGYTYGEQCSLCATGTYGDCFVTSQGCEPFKLWTLEGDGGQRLSGGQCGFGSSTFRGVRYLAAGQHPFKLEYFQRGGDAKAVLRWRGPDTGGQAGNGTFEPISPFKFVFPESIGMKAEWFHMQPPPVGVPQTLSYYSPGMGYLIGATFVHTEDVSMANTHPSRSSQGAALTFSERIDQQPVTTVIRFTGYFRTLIGGTYQFKLSSDDGSRLYIAGQGVRAERLVVNNDGVHERLINQIGTVDLTSGLHFVRIEYLFKPGAVSIFVSFPGIVFEYKGPDTNQVWAPAQDQFISKLVKSNYQCTLSRWALGGGAAMTTDCVGECFDTRESFVGDGKCDRGPPDPGSVLNLQCAQWKFDNNDCQFGTVPAVTTRRPGIMCYEDCPASKWKRNDCASCNASAANTNQACSRSATPAPTCIPTATQPDLCNYRFCCVAKITGLFGWDEDCIQYGTHLNNCSAGLNRIMQQMITRPLTLYEQTVWTIPPVVVPPRQPFTGTVLLSETTPLLNLITPAYVLNQYGGATSQKICPVDESIFSGVQCYEGPWHPTTFTDPLTGCQNGNFEDNFCVNSKTTKGLPFIRCCTMAYVNAQSQQECKFVGIPGGTCANYMAAYQQSVQFNSFLRISNPVLLHECTSDRCNNARPDPNTRNAGCISALNTAPWQTNSLRTLAPNAPLSQATLLAGAPAPPEEPFNSTPIIVAAAGVVALCIAAAVTYKALQVTPPPLWHSQKANVITNDTWIEPKVDHRTGKEYGVVQPREFAFKQIYFHEHPKIIPKALQLDPLEVAVAEEAVQGAVHKQKLFEEDVENGRHFRFAHMVNSGPRQAALDNGRDVYPHETHHHAKTHLLQQLEDRKTIPAELRDHSVAHLPQVVHMPDAFDHHPQPWELEDAAYDLEDGDPEEHSDGSSSFDSFGEGEEKAEKKRRARPRVATDGGDPRKLSKSSKVSSRKASSRLTSQVGAVVVAQAPVPESVVETPEPPPNPDADLVNTAVKVCLGSCNTPAVSRPPAADRMMRKGTGKGGGPPGLPMICT